MYKLIALLVLLPLFSCHSQKKVAEQNPKTIGSNCNPMLSLTEEMNPGASDLFMLDSLAIVGNCLKAFVSYSGGCGGAEFQLYNSNRIKESMPPQTVLFLYLKDEDPCRSIVSDTLYFTLSEFDNLATNRGIWLKFKNFEKKVLYKH